MLDSKEVLAHAHPVCTENSIRIDLVTESPNLEDDGRPVMLLPGAGHIAVQVEEPARSGECRSPASADRAAAEGARSCPTHKRRSLVLDPAVSMVSFDLEGNHDHPA